MIIPVHGIYPKIESKVWIAPNATVIGDVEIGKKTSIWFGVIIRGDVYKIKIGNESNIQDGTVVHCTYKKAGVEIGNRVSIGHNATIHGCKIEDGSLIGMGAIIMDNAVIPKNCLVAAGSLVVEGSTFEEGSLIMGSPAKVKRKLTKPELDFLQKSADNYMKYTTWYVGQGDKIP
ncbi:MAG: gamma carbonic anhydrase family protein [Oligoflexia bacterium]|nr:gamma carbonic anhydrase family protein [Oligoflexia bacterium]